MRSITKYNKLWVALGTAFAFLATATADGMLTHSELIQFGLTLLGALGVYQVKND